MPIRYKKWITRNEVVNNRHILYVFGDNQMRIGRGGQAKEMRGEPNAVGIRTKVTPSMYEHSFWTDDDLQSNVDKLIEDFVPIVRHLKQGGVVIFPKDGIGTGLADLRKRAPLTFNVLQMMIASLEEKYGATTEI